MPSDGFLTHQCYDLTLTALPTNVALPCCRLLENGLDPEGEPYKQPLYRQAYQFLALFCYTNVRNQQALFDLNRVVCASLAGQRTVVQRLWTCPLDVSPPRT